MNSVLKAAGYILAHTPDMVIHNGTTQTTERVVNPDSEYLKVLKDHIRTYDEVIYLTKDFDNTVVVTGNKYD